MLEKIHKQTQICNKSQLIYFVDLLNTGEKPVDDLRIACNSKDYTFSRIFNGLIVFLEWLKIVKIQNANIKILINKNRIYSKDNIISYDFFYLLFLSMKTENILIEFLNTNNVKYIHDEDIIIIDNNLIPFRFSQLRNLLVDLGLFNADPLINSQFVVDTYYKTWFLKKIIPLFKKQDTTKKLSLTKLKKIQKQNELYGQEAEEFVVAYEKARLPNHIRFNEIQIVSED